MVLGDAVRSRFALVRSERRSVVGWLLEGGVAWFCCDLVGACAGDDCCAWASANVEASVVAAAKKRSFLIDVSINGRVGKTRQRGTRFRGFPGFLLNPEYEYLFILPEVGLAGTVASRRATSGCRKYSARSSSSPRVCYEACDLRGDRDLRDFLFRVQQGRGSLRHPLVPFSSPCRRGLAGLDRTAFERFHTRM